MREDANWFAKWEEELPSPEELMPLSQTLITPDLAAAFDITAPNQTPPLQLTPLPQPEFDSTDLSADEPARTLKRPRLVWTPQLHKRFVDAVAHLGIKNAVPKTIMQLMNVDGLTRENVASHLQKYRLYLKRMQGLSSDSACDHLFATTTIPHFLHRQPEDHHLLPFVPVAPALHPHHHHAIAAAAAHNHHHQQQHFGGGGVPFGSPPAVQFDHRFLARHHQPLHRIIPPGAPFVSVEDLGSTSPPTPVSPPGSGRKVLTLFPTAED